MPCHRNRGRPKNTWKEIWSKKWEEQVSGTDGARWRRQHRTELDGDKWFVACAARLIRQVSHALRQETGD